MITIEQVRERLAHITGLTVKEGWRGHSSTTSQSYGLELYLKDTDPGDNDIRVGMISAILTSYGWSFHDEGWTRNLAGWLQAEIDSMEQEETR